MSAITVTQEQIDTTSRRAVEAAEQISRLLAEIHKVMVAQEHLVERLVMALLTDGHVLLEGVPGLAKTLAVRTLAACVSARFARIQFTPDLLPSDLIGSVVYNQHTAQFLVRHGPVFANLILADEINRAPAKVQSALLEAMQERQVTIGDETFPLPAPFVVLATQNPIEQEGTYPLPEAQVDRFMFKVLVTYPRRDDEVEIVRRMTAVEEPHAEAVVSPEFIQWAKQTVRQVYVDDRVLGYIVDLVAATRSSRRNQAVELVEYGASPRAAIWLAHAAKASAFLAGRGYVLPDDVKRVALDVLRHRIIITYEGEAEGVTSETVVSEVLERVKVP